MFFFLIRSFLRWKIQILLDNGQLPDAWMRWFLKKDKVLFQYYLDLLQLEETLNDTSLMNSDMPKSIWNTLFVESRLNNNAKNVIAQHVHKKRHNDFFRSRRRKNFIIATCWGLFVVANLTILFRFLNKHDASVVQETTPKTPTMRDEEKTSVSSQVVILTPQDIIPSEIQEVFRPALIPLRETYESGKQTILDDLGSLPLPPINDLRKFLYTKYETPLDILLQSDTNSSQDSTMSESFFIDRLLNADYWFSTDYQ
ncbi:MAG: hypothetical protein LBT05_04965 [Planctomycetaceae bacterium]|nr:hypothetical protein [Planctomycetaceae bacterium]